MTRKRGKPITFLKIAASLSPRTRFFAPSRNKFPRLSVGDGSFHGPTGHSTARIETEPKEWNERGIVETANERDSRTIACERVECCETILKYDPVCLL
ncbi:hypothetical protein NPIL_297131 [Nephila pilipes]|uniref:Uncharacterized protein n=1 Tax=Nephila pilipes TaxID=299642 RepID=A0A8X6ULN4_NEPPI|nr:hypothetical protein NPIL_297131 [Nephila pilipes]